MDLQASRSVFLRAWRCGGMILLMCAACMVAEIGDVIGHGGGDDAHCAAAAEEGAEGAGGTTFSSAVSWLLGFITTIAMLWGGIATVLWAVRQYMHERSAFEEHTTTAAKARPPSDGIIDDGPGELTFRDWLLYRVDCLLSIYPEA